MKFMIITNNHSWGEGVCGLAQKNGFSEVTVVSHDEALEKFLEFEPTHVLVGEYENIKAGIPSKFALATRTWEDIANSASPEQTIRRCGFTTLNEPDFIRLPFSEVMFKEAFGLT